MTTKKKQVNIRLQPNVYEKLKVIASNDKRAVTNLVEFWVEQAIVKYESEYGENFSLIQNHNNGFGKQINHNNINVPSGA